MFIHIPFCECGVVEDNKHFLFECEQFRLLRQELIDTVSLICQPNLDNLLHGSENLTNDENKKNIFGSAGIYHQI